jgi:O-antigen biosynthesis protein
MTEPTGDRGPRASVVIVTTVNAAGLARTLRSLAALPPDDPSFETIVVLNGAEDDVREVAAGASGVTVVESVVNRGFAGGSNLGRAAASGEFIVMLHDDAEAQEGWLSALVRCADEHPEAGAIGSRVLNPDGTLQFAGAVLWRDATTRGLSGADGDFLERRAVDYAGSSSLLVRAATWDAIGGMDDELYPAYYVDADLAMAIRARGEVILYEPAARAVHQKSASSSPRMTRFYTVRNRERFRAKWPELLAAQEEAEGPEALARAFARSAAEAERMRVAGPPPRWEAPPAPRPADDRRFLRLDREIKDALIEQLTAEVEELHATVRRKDADLLVQQAALEDLHGRLAVPQGPVEGDRP